MPQTTETGLPYMILFLQTLFSFLGVWLGHELAIRQADQGRRKEFALNELDAYQKRTFNELERICSLPRPADTADGLLLNASSQKERNRQEVLAYISETEDKAHYISSLLLANGIKKGRTDELLASLDELETRISGNNFNDSAWWLPDKTDLSEISENHNRVINDLKLELLGAEVEKRIE